MKFILKLKHTTTTKDAEKERCEGRLLLHSKLVSAYSLSNQSQIPSHCNHNKSFFFFFFLFFFFLLSLFLGLGLHTMLWLQWGKFTHRLVEVLPLDAHVAVQHVETHQQSSNHHAFLFEHECSALVKLTARQDRLIFKAQSTGKGLTTVNE